MVKIKNSAYDILIDVINDKIIKFFLMAIDMFLIGKQSPGKQETVQLDKKSILKIKKRKKYENSIS